MVFLPISSSPGIRRRRGRAHGGTVTSEHAKKSVRKLDPEKVSAFRFDRGPVGCLLVHGFAGSPHEMRELGEHLAEQDITTLCEPLPGHGTSPHDMMRTNWHDWHRACVSNLSELSSKCEKVFLAGISMGGTLCLHAAAHYQQHYNVAGVIALSTPVAMKIPMAPVVSVLERFIKFRALSESDVADPAARAQMQSYDRVPLRCAMSLSDLLSHVIHDLQDVHVPVLILHGRKDNMVHWSNADRIHELLGTPNKTIIELAKSGHVITVDHEKDIVKEKTCEFIRQVQSPV